jgi:hypothetical protein
MAMAEKRQHRILSNCAMFGYLLTACLLFDVHREYLSGTMSAWSVMAGAILRASVAYLVLWVCYAHDRNGRPLLVWVVQTAAAMFMALLLVSLLVTRTAQLAGSGTSVGWQFGRCTLESLVLVTLLGPLVLLRGISGMVGDRSFLRLLIRPEMWLGVADASPRPRWWVLAGKR